MTQENPGQSLAAVSAAGAGTAVDFTGGAIGSTTVPYAVPGHVSMAVSVSGYAASSGGPYLSVGLEVSLDGSNWARIATAMVNGNNAAGQATVVRGEMPCRFARATLDALDDDITAVTVSAWVAGAA